MRFTGLFFVMMAGCSWAGELATFANGSLLRVERHEALEDHVRLYLGSGYIEVHANQIKGFEPEPEAPPAAPAEAVAEIPAPPPPAVVPTPLELADAAADKYALPRELVRSVMRAESALQPSAISPKGAIGLMQLMPGTAQVLGADPYDQAQNVDAGTRYLRDLLEKYNYGLRHALAAYNAGPGAVDKYNGVPPYRETINYINRIEKKLRAADVIKQ